MAAPPAPISGTAISPVSPAELPPAPEQEVDPGLAEDVEANAGNVPEEVPAKLSDLIGRKVQWNGYVGTLHQADDGTVVIDDGSREIEIEHSQKTLDQPAGDLGVTDATRPVQVGGENIVIAGRQYALPEEPREAMNWDRSGNLVSVTLQDQESGEDRTIRDPQVVADLGEQLALKHDAARKPFDTPIQPAVEVAGETPVARWIDRWAKGFNPYTVELSDLIDLHDSQMQDEQGGIVGARPEFWDMATQANPRFDVVRGNVESQIAKVEASTLPEATKKELTDELYTLLDRTDGFQKAFEARTPKPPPTAGPESPPPEATPPVSPLEPGGKPARPARSYSN